MKKIITLLVSVLMAFCIVMPISANETTGNSCDPTNYEASLANLEGEVTCYDTLKNALEKAPVGSTVTLLKDLILEKSVKTVNFGVTIDLNGFNIDGTAVKTSSSTGVLNLRTNYGSNPVEGISNTILLTNSKTSGGLIKGGLPIYSTVGNSKYELPIDIGDNITLESTTGGELILLNSSAYLVYSDKNASYFNNGMFKVTDSRGEERIYGQYANASKIAEGREITLLHDYKGNSTIKSGSVSSVLNLNGNTYTYTGTTGSMIDVNYPNVELKIKNGTLHSVNDVDGAHLVGAGTTTSNLNNRSLVLEGVTMNVDGNDAYGIVTNGTESGNNIELIDSELNVSNGYGIYFPSEGNVVINNTTIKADYVGVQMCAGNLTVSGDSYISATAFADPEDKTGDGVIPDGSALSIVERDGYKGIGKINIEGGKFLSSNSKSVNAYRFSEDDKDEPWDEAKDNGSVSAGTFSDDSALTYLADDSLTVAEVTDNNDDTTYAIGNDSIEEAIADATKVIITQGSIDLTNVPDGIEVSNTGNGEVTVNDQEVTDEPVVTHTHEWVLDSTNFADDHSKADFLFVCSKDETHNQTLTDNELDVTRVEATTEEDGKVEYKASVVFEGKTYDATDTVTIAKLPVITSKDDQSFTLGSKGTLTFTSDADYDNFLKVLVDNKELAKENYTVKEGSTVVTLSNEYLNTLSAGTHELSIVSNNGTATTTFKIVKGADPEIVVPGTGINDTVMPVAIGSIILAFGAVSLVVLKKRYSK